MYELKIKRIWHSQLPHWEVERGVYFITIRCAGNLPSAVVGRITEIQKTISTIKPASDEFHQLQRQYFMTLEKYLDAGKGFAPFKEDRCCELTVSSFSQLMKLGWDVRHYALMPNHVHLVVWAEAAADMATTWREWKGRLALECNRHLGRTGAFWQNDWFDRVLRSENETKRVITYVKENPKKAGLPEDYKWAQ